MGSAIWFPQKNQVIGARALPRKQEDRAKYRMWNNCVADCPATTAVIWRAYFLPKMSKVAEFIQLFGDVIQALPRKQEGPATYRLLNDLASHRHATATVLGHAFLLTQEIQATGFSHSPCGVTRALPQSWRAE